MKGFFMTFGLIGGSVLAVFLCFAFGGLIAKAIVFAFERGVPGVLVIVVALMFFAALFAFLITWGDRKGKGADNAEG